jgi:hypothetical protein
MQDDVPSRSELGYLRSRTSNPGREEGLEYMHGLWRRHFLFDLLWFIKSGQTEKPSSERRTRSWSWQTVAGEVSQRLMSYGQLSMGKERSLMKVAELVTTKDGEVSPPLAATRSNADWLLENLPTFSHWLLRIAWIEYCLIC